MRTTLRRLLSTLGAVALVTTFFTASPASAEPTYNLTSISVEGSVTPTSAATLRYTVSGTLPRRIEAYFVSDASGATTTAAIATPAGNGTYTFSWDARWPAGTYSLRTVRLLDQGVQSELWTDSGTITRSGVVVGSHTLDLGSVAYDLSGPQTGELAAPRLTGARLIGAPNVVGAIPLELTTVDEEPTLLRVSVQWDANANAGGMAVPTGTTTFSASATAGKHALQSIELQDQHGVTSKYFRDGTFRIGAASPTEKHGINFAALDLALVPAAPQVRTEVRSLPNGAELGWFPQPPTGVERWIISAVPGTASVTVANPTPSQWRWDQLIGLTPGVTHTIYLTAVGSVGPSAPTKVAVVTPQMASNIVGVPRYSVDRPFLAALVTSRTRGDHGTVRQYDIAGGRLLAPSIRAVGVPRIASGGDLLRQGGPMVLCVFANGDLALGSDYSSPIIGKGWGTMRWIDGGSDFSGDGHTDVIAVDSSGNLKLFPTTGPAKFGATRTIGVGWSGFRTVFSPGDFDGDRKADVMAVDSAGALWLYRGNGAGSWLGKVKVGSGWNGFGSVNAARDFTGDGFEDVLTVQMDGVLKIYPGNGRGGWLATRTVGSGWHTYY